MSELKPFEVGVNEIDELAEVLDLADDEPVTFIVVQATKEIESLRAEVGRRIPLDDVIELIWRIRHASGDIIGEPLQGVVNEAAEVIKELCAAIKEIENDNDQP